jgi:hypothetical protein
MKTEHPFAGSGTPCPVTGGSRRFIGSSILVAAALFGLGASSAALAGSVFVTGHDSDFHAFAGGNAIGAQNIINRALDFTRNGNTAPILLLETSTANNGLGDHVDSEQGLIASGYIAGTTPGNHYVKLNASQFATANLAQFSSLFIPSDHGGSLTGDDLNALNSRGADIIGYLNAGGGLFAMAEDGFHTPATTAPEGALFGFLPFLATSAPLGEFEGGNTLTPFGSSLGLTTSDINGNFSHNIFTSTGGMTPVDYDARGEILSLGWRGSISIGGVPDAGSSLLLLGASLAGLLGLYRRLQA